MAIDIKFDLVNNPEPPTIILANRNGNKLGQLDFNTDSFDLSDKLNDASEISFTLNKYTGKYIVTDKGTTEEEITNLWDKVVDFKLVYCKEWDMWFEIKVELDESTETVKTVFCTQLGQAELSQIMLYNIEINTEDDIARDDYKISILYDENDPKASILNRMLEKAPHYRIAYVSPTISKIQRSFSFDGTSIVDGFNEIGEEIGCLFDYPSGSGENGKIQRDIYVYDLWQTCSDCGHRSEYIDECPKCGSKNIIKGYGEDTLIFVTADELASDSIQLVTDTNSVKNCFKLEAGDDLMTAAVRSCNPNGSDYIWYLSDTIKEDMSEELVQALTSYDIEYKKYIDKEINLNKILVDNYNNLVDKYDEFYNAGSSICFDCDYKGDFEGTCPNCGSKNILVGSRLKPISTPIKGYSSLMNVYYDIIDLDLYLKSGLMPSVEISDTSAKEQAALLTASALSPIAVTDVTIVSPSTAASAAEGMARTIINSTYKVDTNQSEIIDGVNSKSWRGNFKIVNYSDETDYAISEVITIAINDDLETFIEQKIDKALKKEETDDLSIVGLFNKEYDDFCIELKKYALNPLINIDKACDSCITILIDQGVGDKDTWADTDDGAESNLYEKLYIPYRNKKRAIEAEIKIREGELKDVEELQINIEECKNEIQDALNFEDYLGEDLWLEFCAYRREDKYSNSNYISDGLNNTDLFKNALQFFETAQNDIYKSAELQHSISTTLNNLLAIEKFKPLADSFKVGNWIRVQIDDGIYKLRLLEYGIDYSNFDNIPVEFSDVIKIKNGITDVKSILSQASSMASSYDSVQRQAIQGDKAKDTVDEWHKNGINSAIVQIQSNDDEEITLNKNGLLCRSYDDIAEDYSPEQFRLTHNIMAYTTDNWETVSSALGKHKYVYYNSNKILQEGLDYGLSAKFVTAGYVNGSQIIGGEIYSSNYSEKDNIGTYIDLINGKFSIAGGKLTYDNEELSVNGNITATSGTIGGCIISDGVLKIGNTNIGEKITASSIDATNLEVSAANVTGTLVASQIDATNLKVKAANIDGTLTASQINTKGLIAENISGTTLSGKTISGGSINIGSGKFIVTSGGVMTAKSGTFGGTLSAVSGSFTSLSAGSSYFTSTYITIDANGYGSVRIGTPDYYDWQDLTIRPSQNHIGNIGTPEYAWDTLYVRMQGTGSKRDIKEDISIYNTELAYEELKTLPIYTYFYKEMPSATKNMSIGTMIDYIPAEAMLTTPNGSDYYNTSSMIFWNIAASQVMQSKLEDLINKVNELEEKIG